MGQVRAVEFPGRPRPVERGGPDGELAVTARAAGTPGSDASPLAPEPRRSGAPSARARALLWIEDGGGLAPDVPAGAVRRLRGEAVAAAARIAARPREEDLG